MKPHRMLLLIVAICMFFTGQSAFAAEQEPWWVSEIISAEGNGFAPRNIDNPEQAKLLAKEAARLDAYRRLAETAAGIHITANETIAEGEVNAVISGAKIAAEKYDEKTGRYTIIMQVPLYGVSNSISSAVFKNYKQENVTPQNTPYKGEQKYTGVIIDCSDAPVKDEDEAESKGLLTPVLLPVIKTTSGEVIYSANNFDKQTLIVRGMASYATDYDSENIKRAGSNPYIIKAVRLDDNGCSPVISDADGKFIKEHNLCNDVNLVHLSTRGHRDSKYQRKNKKGIHL
ncbi:MAG: hypothetical protein IKN12_06455 [Selenomonadaceae bacterium]|nr:hypothetical protein [Selenomonadaceae bacterium]